MHRILIAEDNETNMKLMYDVLTAKGYAVEKAWDGEEAIAKLAQADYDLLILDIQMPKKSGYDVLKELKNDDIRVLVVSACAMDQDIELAKTIRCLDYMTKPIKIFVFLEKVSSILL